MKANKKDNRCGIYCIRNIVTNKVYIGKSKNVHKRIIQHICDLNKEKSLKENLHLINSWKKYGRDSFEYFVLEYLNMDEKIVAERELYWMKIYDSLNKNKGYNLRSDSDSQMIIHESTSKKISERLKKEWSEGIRKNHSKKLSDNWKKNPERKKEQSSIMSKNLTKYIYNLYDFNNSFIESCDYKRLEDLKLSNVITSFYRKKTNKLKFKSFIIERVNIEDIVRSS